MKETLKTVWITLLAALLIFGMIGLLTGWATPWIQSILADSSTAVKSNEALLRLDEREKRWVILDPGHGGEDPGAIGCDGVLEKDLNLVVALRLRDLLVFNGWRVIMTRSDDRLLYDPEIQSSHKVQDLQSRLDYGKLYPNAIFVSIHMNKFPDARCAGLQVYYSGNHTESECLAKSIETFYANAVTDGRVRASKRATSSIFILHRIQIPAVLVECGFLSNPNENEYLQTAEYQKKLAAVIVSALVEIETQ